ncbi:hypothetical protein RFI_14519 [Reticulomyxa filosa]|uniref:Uncharacterized protein n=1 Tax=Reticulomyxa filosa TaxID=46433 RepID=X6N9T8_RETFI|nr:hypothetical protein RFI_14519 [Reticulomyxa filosa]|eukprot:ETO22678.1 hypothetical protein RFI_14519 [Reticulomyxa filosa]
MNGQTLCNLSMNEKKKKKESNSAFVFEEDKIAMPFDIEPAHDSREEPKQSEANELDVGVGVICEFVVDQMQGGRRDGADELCENAGNDGAHKGAPVAVDLIVMSSDLDGKEHAANGGAQNDGHGAGASCGQQRLALKMLEYATLGQLSSDNRTDMNERPFNSNRQSTGQA